MKAQFARQKISVSVFAVVLLIYGIQGTSYGDENPAVEGEITTCEANHLGLNHFNVTVAGTVTARRSVTSLRVTAYANGDWIGIHFIGQLSAGRSANFSITGLYVKKGNENQLDCSAEWNWLEWVTTGSEDDDEQTTPDSQQSDLVVEQPTVSESALTPGENFTLSATVTNEGAGSAAATTLRYYRSTDATILTSDTEVGTDNVSGLGAAESSAESIILTAPTSPGTYYYGACVDSVTDESNSNNNCSAAVSITVQPLTSGTEMTSDESGAAALTVEPGDDDTTLVISFTDTFDWIQEHAAYQFEARRKSPLGAWHRGCTETPVDVPFPQNDVSGIVTIEIIGLDPGTTYQVRYRKGGVFQRCSHTVGWGNWSALVEGTTSGEVLRSDLVVEQLTVSQNTLVPGENFTLSTTVTNEGAGSAAATTLRYYRSTDATISTSDTEIGIDNVSGLGANESSAESISLTAPTVPGTYYYGACAEAVTDESSLDNNCSAAVSIMVQQPTLSASTLSPLIETTLDGSEVILMLTAATYEQSLSNIRNAVMVSGLAGVSVGTVRRGSDTEVTVDLAFDGTDFDTDGILTFTVGAGAIAGYDDSELTAQVSVTAVKAIEFNLSVPAGISLIHVPLKVTAVDGVARTIESVADLYGILGGEDNVIYLFTRDAQAEQWIGYFAPTSTDRKLTDDMGIITRLIESKEITISGAPLGENGNSNITLHRGVNLVGTTTERSKNNTCQRPV